MLEKLKNSRDARLAISIAAGVFGGLLAYRLVMNAVQWWAAAWTGITDLQKTELQITVWLTLVLIVGWTYRCFGKDIKSFCSKRRRLLTLGILVACCVTVVATTAIQQHA